MNQSKEYYAFISYKREDEKWAKWLQHKLEHYKLPSNVRKGNAALPKDLRPVFKDTSELASGVLSEEIHSALEKSKYLIVICSPRAAKSEWVCKEVQSFIDMGRTKDIIPFIVGGKAFASNPEQECFPSALRQLPSEQELLGVNINEMGKDAAVVKVIAQMLGLKFDTLWQRHQKEKTRRSAIISASAVFLTTVFIASLWIWHQNSLLQESNNKIKEAQSRFIAEKINNLISEGDSYTATLLALETLPTILNNPNRPYVPEAEYALRQLVFRHSALLHTKYGTPKNVSFTQDGRYLIALLEDSMVQVWDYRNGAVVDTMIAFPKQNILSEHGSLKVIVPSKDINVIMLSDTTENMWKREWQETDDSISSIALSPDNNLLASVSRDKYLRLYDIHTGEMLHTRKAHDASIRSVSFSPDCVHLATGSRDGVIKIWEKTLRKSPIVFQGHNGQVYSAVFSPDGEKIVSSSDDKTIKLWDAHSGKLLSTGSGHLGKVRGATFSPNGRYVGSASYDKTIKIWDAQSESLRLLKTLEGHNSTVCCVQFSPDNKTIASVSWDNTVKIWDLETGRVISEWEAHHSGIHSVSFSPDGKRLLTVSWEKNVKIWDVATGRLVHELIGHTKNVTSAAFSPDGTQILTSSEDGTIKLWDFLPLQELIDMTRNRFKDRQLTSEERRKYYLE